jgi:type IV pilus assembly protein PilY1
MTTLRNHRAVGFVAGMLWAVLSGAPAVADDTELFIGTSASAGVQPNILFIVDNSGSMGTLVRTQDTYDGSVSYPAGSSGCDANRVYWRSGSGTMPNCNTNRWFDLSALRCQAALQAFLTVGYYSDWMGQYDPSNGGNGKRWEALSQSQNSRVVECEDDAGVHGDGTDTANLYARNGSVGTPGYWGTFANRITNWQASPLDTQPVTLYSGNYMNWTYGPTLNRTRLEIVQEVANDLLDSVNGVNVGLVTFNPPAGFDGSEGGYVVRPMGDISTTRAAMQADISALTPNAWTPLSETMYEAALYMTGGGVDFGNPNSVASSRAPSDPNTYNSPINNTCQKNYIVFLTDGEPTFDTSADADIRALTDANGESFANLVGNTCDVETYPAGFSPSGGNCLDELAEFLNDGDFSIEPGQQNINTYTVGFTVDLPILDDTATRGGGQYYTADNTATLADALQQIVTSILSSNTTFTAPTVAVNAFNRTQNLSDLFISVFRPSARMHWPGNLKKFRLDVASGDIVDANGDPAIDPASGFFAETAQDFWSLGPDGEDVEGGGAANIIPIPASRAVYTYLGNADLNAAGNRIDVLNAGLTDVVLNTGGDGEPTRADVINFINGLDVTDTDQDNLVNDPRTQLGDPLHSQPVSMVYGAGGLRDGLIFSATNDGFLHAFDLETGIEQWAFIPPEFLDDQVQLFNNDPSAAKHYGVDGDIALQIVADNDGIIESGEKVYLFFGTRRGGDFYYGLDVSDPSNPQFLWRLDGATLPGLGQAWSTPVPTRVQVAGATQNADHLALVIGGGYEPDQDVNAASTDTIGNSIYIVDSVNGTLLWHGGKVGTHKSFAVANRAMDYSIPSDVTVIDLGGDGYADRMYVGDMGGQVWRFDIARNVTAADLVNGGVIAQLGAAPALTPALTDVRRFYYAPDAAVINTRGYDFVHVGIGSGHRGHPLSTAVQDRFYSLRDYHFRRYTQAEFDSLTLSTDANLTPITSANTSVPQGTSRGWRLDLTGGGAGGGEKVLAEAKTFDGDVVFTTFRPGTSGTSCTPQLGTNRVYKVSVINAAPVTNLDGSVDPTTLTLDDLFVESEGAPLPSPQLIFLAGDKDGNGIPDPEDDTDNDGIPDDVDTDYDGDGVIDANKDTDGDGTPDHSDNDIDGDDIPNNEDDDIDGDGILNVNETDNQGPGARLVVGLMTFPEGYKNDPVRTFWNQESLDN